MKILSDERGQAMILMLFCLTCLMGFVGLAVDVGTLFRAKRVMQIAADSGAVAGAAELNYGDVTTAAAAATAQNGITNGSNGSVVTVNTPPQNGPHTGNANYVEVIVSQSQPTFFLRLFNWNSMRVDARAVATLANSPNCIYTLNPNGTDILINGGVTVTAPQCGIIDDSTSNQALVVNGVDQVNVRSIGTVGNYFENGAPSVTPTPVAGIAAETNPLQFLSPPTFNPASCTAQLFNGVGTFQLGPATPGGTVCYSSLILNGAPNVTLTPGVYVIDGLFLINGAATLTGTGVTFYFPNNTASFVGNDLATLNLSAPTSGPYDGILLYQDPSDTQFMTFNGGTNSILKGIFYLPTANLLLNGVDTDTLYTDIVAGALTLNGVVNLQDYASINSSTPLTAARLVE
jgi:Flp pilus assembly protein TadG